MTTAVESRALICAPYGRDAGVLAQVCRDLGWEATCCARPGDLVREATHGFLLIALSEEACTTELASALRTIWHEQPSWSHPPLIVLLDSIERTPGALAGLIAELAISTCVRLKRPLRRRDLTAAIEAQAAFRQRQYETRDLILSSTSEEQRQQFRLRELEHRVNNMLASLTALLRMTARSARDIEHFTTAFGGRLEALARVHQRLAKGDDGDLPLRQVIEDCLLPYCASGDQIVQEGEDVTVGPKTAIWLTMMLHELATNASKYGAFTSEQGRVRLSWSVDREAEGVHKLKLDWREFSGPPVEPPASKGFGTLMLEQMASAEFRGQAELRFEREGLLARLEVVLR